MARRSTLTPGRVLAIFRIVGLPGEVVEVGEHMERRHI
jgi:hypothetical protein